MSNENSISLISDYKPIDDLIWFGKGLSLKTAVNEKNNTFPLGGVINQEYPNYNPEEVVFTVKNPLEAKAPEFLLEVQNNNQLIEEVYLFPSISCLYQHIKQGLQDELSDPELRKHAEKVSLTSFISTVYAGQRALIPSELYRLIKTNELALFGSIRFILIKPIYK